MIVEHLRGKLVGLAAFVVGAVLIFLVLFTMAGGQLRTSRPYTVSADVRDPLFLVPNSDVRRAGVVVGRVAKVQPYGSGGRLTLELDKDLGPVYRNARVQVRTKSLVGENYVDLDPGTPAAGRLPDGAVLPVANERESVRLDEILDALDPRTRREVRRNIRALAAGTTGRGTQINDTWADLRPTALAGERLTSVLAAQRHRLGAVVDDTATVLDAFSARSAQLQRLVRAGQVAAEATAARDTQLAEGIQRLPGTLRTARGTLAALGGLATDATPVFGRLRVAADDLRPAMINLSPAAIQGRRLMAQMRPLARAATPLLDELHGFSVAARPAFGALGPFLREANPALTYLSGYSRDFGAFFANVGSIMDSSDPVGPRFRAHGVFSDTSLVGQTPSQRKAIEALEATGGIDRVHHEFVNPYPRPGTVGSPVPWAGQYPRLSADPAPGRRR